MKKIEDFGSRLKTAMFEAKVSRKDLAANLGISVQAIGMIITGQSKAFTAENTAKAAEFLGCSSKWLATGAGEMNLKNISILEFKHDEILIPQFNAVGAMGNGLVLRDQSGVIESWRVSPEWLNKNVKLHSGVKNLVIVTGFGDSMRPMFNSGDPLLVDIGVRSVEFDAIYFFRVGNEGFIKRLQRIPGDGIRAISENKGYEGWTIKPDMDFEVFGRVLKVWRGEEF